jgi:hypothetical protein
MQFTSPDPQLPVGELDRSRSFADLPPPVKRAQRDIAQNGKHLVHSKQFIALHIGSPSVDLNGSGSQVRPVVVAGADSRGESEFGGGCGGVAGALVAPVGQHQDDGFVERAAPRVVFAFWVALLFAVFGAGTAELAEGDGVAAGFGEKVAAVAEGVGPFAQPGPGRSELPAARVPKRW